MTSRAGGVKRAYCNVQPCESVEAETQDDAESPPLTIGRPLRLERSPASSLAAIAQQEKLRLRDCLLLDFERLHARARTYDAQLEFRAAQSHLVAPAALAHWRHSIVDQLFAQDCSGELMNERHNMCTLWLEGGLAGPVPRYDRMGGDISQLAIRFARMDDHVEWVNGPAGNSD